MKLRWTMALIAGLALAIPSAQAQTATRVRGTITAVDGATLAVKSRDGRDLTLKLADNVTVAVATAIRFEDIKVGDYLGVTSQPRADGVHVAVEVHYLAPTVPEGQLSWDLLPGSTMTNANVASMVTAAANRELTLTYKGGTQRVVVPEGAPIVRAIPGARSDLAVGEYVFAAAQADASGALGVARIQVSKNGVKPPQ